ncbi:hypothetical protein EYC80_003504 [Monilinia laxa]|uniref:Isochorismatase-like domain-containing protein n=1 Tax=Monilinia laxa TaxID=61186 RepID=A0A5N6KDU8_MONLA|nr:hypothetical protein EYC80_003504 [Monilinia laxa]
MEGSNGPSVYQQVLSSSISIHTNSATILPIAESNRILSKIKTNGDASVASDKIYDEIDELKFEIKARAVSDVIVTDTKSTKSRRSSFLSKFLNFHRNPPRSISTQNHHQTLDSAHEKDSNSSIPPKTMDITIDDDNSLLLQDNRRLSGQFCARPYHWPHDASLDKSTTALVIIDMQKDFASDKGYLAKQGIDNKPILNIVPKIRKLLDVCRANGFPIYHTREGHRPDLSTLSSRERFRSRNNESKLGIGDMGPLGRLLIRGEKGHEIIDELTPLKDEQVIDKPGRSAFQHTEFRLMLNIRGIKNLIICGVTTDVCVTSTMREANDNNFDCVLVEDACAAGVDEYHKSAVESITEEGGIFGAVTTLKDVLEKLGMIMDRRLSIDIVNSETYPPSIGGPLSDYSEDFSQNPKKADQPGSIFSSSLKNNHNVRRGHSVRLENEPVRVEDYIDDGTQPRNRRSSVSTRNPVLHLKGKSSSLKDGLGYLAKRPSTEAIGNKFGTNKLIKIVDEEKPEKPQPSPLQYMSDDDGHNGGMPCVSGDKILSPKFSKKT